MITVTLEAGKSAKAITNNAKKLMRVEGMERDEAYRYAYDYGHNQSARVFKSMHVRSQKEQRKR